MTAGIEKKAKQVRKTGLKSNSFDDLFKIKALEASH